MFSLKFKNEFQILFLLQVTKTQVLKPLDSPEKKEDYNFRLAWYFFILSYPPHPQLPLKTIIKKD